MARSTAETVFCSKCGSAMPPDASFCSRCGAVHAPVVVQATAGVRYAGFWLRLVANLLDQVIIGAAVGLLFIARFGTRPPRVDIIEPAFIVFTVVGLKWLYFALLESSEWQATVGKKALGLVVTTTDGQPISFLQATARFFGKFVSDAILGIGYIMAGFTAKKQALHDMIAGTLVVKR